MGHRSLARASVGCAAACLVSVTANATMLEATSVAGPGLNLASPAGSASWQRDSLAAWVFAGTRTASGVSAAASDLPAWSLNSGPSGTSGGALHEPQAMLVPRPMLGALPVGLARFQSIDAPAMSPVPLPGSLPLFAWGILAGFWLLRRPYRAAK
jgi:hypothetical protein